jgi:hypothetical protein
MIPISAFLANLSDRLTMRVKRDLLSEGKFIDPSWRQQC